MSDLMGSWVLKRECKGCGFHLSRREATGGFECGDHAEEVRAVDAAVICLD